MTALTKKSLLAKLKFIEPKDDDQRNHLVCGLIGHSHIITTFFGYIYCGRCGDQIGDALGGYFNAETYTIVEHDCEMCRKNYEAMKWQDKLYAPYPFKVEVQPESNLEAIQENDNEE